MANQPPDYGHRLRCPACGNLSIDPTRKLLHCMGTCASKFDSSMPKCFEYPGGPLTSEDLAMIRGGAEIAEALIEIPAPGHCCGLPPEGE